MAPSLYNGGLRGFSEPLNEMRYPIMLGSMDINQEFVSLLALQERWR